MGLVLMCHPVHVSVTNLEYDPGSGKLKASVKLFYDDFELILANKYGVVFHFADAKPAENEGEYFLKYINEHLVLKANGERLTAEFSHREFMEDSIWLFLSYNPGRKIRDISVTNSLMFDLFGDQSNLLMLKYGEFENGYIMKGKHYKIDIVLPND